MKILITNDDGIFAEGLWALVKELRNIAQVIVVAPDREQSAVGTAVTLWQPLRIRKVKPVVPEVETYAIEGTPSDSVILALGNLVKGKVDLVISGINVGLNLGNDVLISGTVGAALQGYLRGFPAIAISVSSGDDFYLDGAAKVAALLVGKIGSNILPPNIFLNVNMPELLPSKIKGVKVTRLATASHIDTVEEGHDGRREYYWLKRQNLDENRDVSTDMGAIELGNISITPLHTYLNSNSSPAIRDSIFSDILAE